MPPENVVSNKKAEPEMNAMSIENAVIMRKMTMMDRFIFFFFNVRNIPLSVLTN